jgi:hypothetical protein
MKLFDCAHEHVLIDNVKTHIEKKRSRSFGSQARLHGNDFFVRPAQSDRKNSWTKHLIEGMILWV